MAISKHTTHYGPRSGILEYNLTVLIENTIPMLTSVTSIQPIIIGD